MHVHNSEAWHLDDYNRILERRSRLHHFTHQLPTWQNDCSQAGKTL